MIMDLKYPYLWHLYGTEYYNWVDCIVLLKKSNHWIICQETGKLAEQVEQGSTWKKNTQPNEKYV